MYDALAILICIGVLVIYLNTKRYYSIQALSIIILFILLIILKIKEISLGLNTKLYYYSKKIILMTVIPVIVIKSTPLIYYRITNHF